MAAYCDGKERNSASILPYRRPRSRRQSARNKTPSTRETEKTRERRIAGSGVEDKVTIACSSVVFGNSVCSVVLSPRSLSLLQEDRRENDKPPNRASTTVKRSKRGKTTTYRSPSSAVQVWSANKSSRSSGNSRENDSHATWQSPARAH